MVWAYLERRDMEHIGKMVQRPDGTAWYLEKERKAEGEMDVVREDMVEMTGEDSEDIMENTLSVKRNL